MVELYNGNNGYWVKNTYYWFETLYDHVLISTVPQFAGYRLFKTAAADYVVVWVQQFGH